MFLEDVKLVAWTSLTSSYFDHFYLFGDFKKELQLHIFLAWFNMKNSHKALKVCVIILKKTVRTSFNNYMQFWTCILICKNTFTFEEKTFFQVQWQLYYYFITNDQLTKASVSFSMNKATLYQKWLARLLTFTKKILRYKI